MSLEKEISRWIKKHVEKAGKKGVIFGLSGGIDSAVVAVLSARALGNDNVLGLVLPCESNPEDVELALKLGTKFNIKTRKVELDTLFSDFRKIYPEAGSIAKANLKPRLRMTVLYYFANTLDYLVAGTGNKSELTVGYFTKYGDGGVDILPLGGLLKTEVRKLAKSLDIPREIIERPPSAGLWHGQTDEAEMGITYEELDKTIAAIEKKKTGPINEDTLKRVRKMMSFSEHKRAKIPVFKKDDAEK